MERIRIKPLTEDQKSEVRAYFENKTIEQLSKDQSNQRIWFNYGRMRSRGEKIEVAEGYCENVKNERSNQYRFIKENEIKEKLKDREIKNGGGYNYDVVNLRFYEDGRVLEIGIMNGVKDNGETKWSNTIDIEERHNPNYFKELLRRYKIEE